MPSALMPMPSWIRASAQDAGNASMRRGGRRKWSRADVNAATDALDRLVSSSYGEGDWGRFRYQIASELEQDRVISHTMTIAQLNAAIDAALVHTVEVAS